MDQPRDSTGKKILQSGVDHRHKIKDHVRIISKFSYNEILQVPKDTKGESCSSCKQTDHHHYIRRECNTYIT